MTFLLGAFKFFRATWWIWVILGVLGYAVHWHNEKAQEAVNKAVYDNVYRIVYAAEEKRVAQEKADAEVAKARAAERVVVTEKVVTKYVDRIKYVKGKTIEVIKEIPVYVPADAAPIHPSFRVLHDYAAVQTGPVPDAPRIADAAPVPVEDAARTIAENYGTCHETGERLIALQDWVTKQSAIGEQ